MNLATQNLFAATLTAIGLIGAGAVQAHTDDASFDQVAKSHAVESRSAWVNPIMPSATGSDAFVTACGDMDFNGLAHRYVRADSKWVNALLPQATGEFSSVARGEAADAQFNRQVASYSRQVLDRGGWVNAFVKEGNYAIGNRLLAARIGEGVTTRIVT